MVLAGGGPFSLLPSSPQTPAGSSPVLSAIRQTQFRANVRRQVRTQSPSSPWCPPAATARSTHNPCANQSDHCVAPRRTIKLSEPPLGSTSALNPMRFSPEGPSIPDDLLEERDRGNVVFFCGAGVSLSAGMPTFHGLTKYVVDELKAPPESESRKMLAIWDDEAAPLASRPAFDQVFNVLQQEYPPSEIDYFVAKRLQLKRKENTAAHRTILRLAQGPDSTSRIVTTNFDLLFEKAQRGLNRFVAPALPDLASGQSLNGLVYLHGRLDSRLRRSDGRHGFVLSSSDFGRAYLADAWATRFVRDLLDRHIVVLLGYSASDPPIRYLLQGLHTRVHGRRATIYAFDCGTAAEVEQNWRGTGVRVLSYSQTDTSHSALWTTLDAWADRAEDANAWRERIVKLSLKGPRSLTPVERGQVASLVRTETGAKLFAYSDPLPPAEWLCVFDRNVRYGEVVWGRSGSEPDFDPLVVYRLDDDPPRAQQGGRPREPLGDDAILFRATDRREDHTTRLAGIGRRRAAPLPSRLFHLARWVARVADEPIVPWWAAKYGALHPTLLFQIESRIEHRDDNLSSEAKLIWTLLIEKFRTAPEDELDSGWFRVIRRINSEGWSNSVLRAFQRCTSPYIKTEVPLGIGRSCPPIGNWGEIKQRDIAEFDVAFPGYDREELKIPEAVLPRVYQTLRAHLGLAAELLSQMRLVHWRAPTLYPEDRPGSEHLSDEDSYFRWFAGVIDALTQTNPQFLAADIVLWQEEEPYFFNKLRLYVWAKPSLLSSEIVADKLLSLSDEAFWTHENRRELLFLLKVRWEDIPGNQRRMIESRIVNGRDKYLSEDEDEFERSRSVTSAVMLEHFLIILVHSRRL